MRRIISFFQTLRGKLILTYTIVTVLALLALEITIMFFGVLLSKSSGSSTASYLNDVIHVLGPQAEVYLEPGRIDTTELSQWLKATYDSGYASLPPQYFMDNPAAMIVKSDPMYVVSPEGVVLAAAPENQASLVGKKYTPPAEVPASAQTFADALKADVDPSRLSALSPEGDYWMAVPVTQSADNGPLLRGVVVLTVQAPPPYINSVLPVFGVVMLLTGIVLLIGVAPFGAVFGFIMSAGLTRRLKALTRAADAWSEGDFSIQPPQDKSKDEISYLGLRMRRMAEHVQVLLQSQHEMILMEERNRLARELHDTVKQETFATLMQVRAAKNLLDRDLDSARQHLDEAEDLIKTSQQELGLMIAELRPAALEGQGLTEALRGFLNSWSAHSRIPVDFQVQNERRLPLEIEQNLYRVAQEALSNVARHSRASAVSVHLSFDLGQVILCISDNGVGFDPKSVNFKGFGLQSMRDRMAAMHGHLEIRPAPEGGTTLIAGMPVHG
jgi:two-component system, NarL family, sensor histidine kinase LiaS